MLYFTLSDVLALPYYYTRTRLHQLLHEMGLKSRTSFLRKGAERHTTDDTPCCICHETIAKKSTFWYLCAQLRNTRNATRNFVLRGHAGGSKTLTPRAESSPWNCMMRIKRCGHCFCYDCLETWVQEKNTCPMCRDVLFGAPKRDKHAGGEQQARGLRHASRGHAVVVGQPVERRAPRNSIHRANHGYVRESVVEGWILVGRGAEQLENAMERAKMG